MTSPPPHFVQEAVFNHVEGDYNDNRTYNVHNIHYNSAVHPLERLERHVSKGAAHNSAERGPDAPKCAEETRKAVQADILSWIGYGSNDIPPSNILWLSGPAGCGKTAIMGSVADACHERGWLAGSFFLSSFVLSSPDRRSKNCIIPTLAYHLIQHSTIPGLKEEVLDAVNTNLLVFNSSVQEQLRVLIIQPLAKLDLVRDHNFWPKVLLVDGLDECDGDEGGSTSQLQTSRERNHREIIATLARAAADPSFPFRIVIASRPERAIANAFTALQSPPNPIKRIFLDDKYSPEADIALYLRASFIAIGREKGLGDGWFPSNAPQALAKEASGQFIYASTVLRFVRHRPTSIPSLEPTFDRGLRRTIGSPTLAPPCSLVDAGGTPGDEFPCAPTFRLAFYDKRLRETNSRVPPPSVLLSTTNVSGTYDERLRDTLVVEVSRRVSGMGGGLRSWAGVCVYRLDFGFVVRAAQCSHGQRLRYWEGSSWQDRMLNGLRARTLRTQQAYHLSDACSAKALGKRAPLRFVPLGRARSSKTESTGTTSPSAGESNKKGSEYAGLKDIEGLNLSEEDEIEDWTDTDEESQDPIAQFSDDHIMAKTNK
ncbi:hypothetical protein NMY22_g5326 [Coprinellus aureogranulatus]|nr:hypothetical protein NMY22_g5326 [Coprinellus aureogranulatus]